jgi:hypothetical protein
MFRDDASRSGYRQNRGRGYSQPRDDRQAPRGATRGGDRNPPGSSSKSYFVGCKKRGHFSSQCRNHAGNPKNHPWEIERGMTCKYCMKRGHPLQNCTLKNTEGYRKWRNHKGSRPDETENRDRRGRKRLRLAMRRPRNCLEDAGMTSRTMTVRGQARIGQIERNVPDGTLAEARTEGAPQEETGLTEEIGAATRHPKTVREVLRAVRGRERR